MKKMTGEDMVKVTKKLLATFIVEVRKSESQKRLSKESQ